MNAGVQGADLEGLPVVFVGALGEGRHSRARLAALERLGCRVAPVDLASVDPAVSGASAAWRALRRRVSWPADEGDVNGRLRAAAARMRPRLVWLEKALSVAPRTLSQLRRAHPDARIVVYLPDTLRHWGQRSVQLLGCARRSDVVVTPNPRAYADLRRLGCPVTWGEKAFDPQLHRPLPMGDDERKRWGAPVGFVGFWEKDRAGWLRWLHAEGVELKIWGQRWVDKTRGSALAGAVAGSARFGEDYVRILNSLDIGLCFLRHQAGDQVTSRSMEIPACGTFMLGERTPEHLSLFREGEEAEFFEGYDELRDKVFHYLAHPEERRRIAEAGRRRCLASGYDQDSRMRSLLRRIL